MEYIAGNRPIYILEGIVFVCVRGRLFDEKGDAPGTLLSGSLSLSRALIHN